MGYIPSHPPTLPPAATLDVYDCPWVLRAERSQRFNFSLIDFGLLLRAELDVRDSVAQGACQVYAIFEVCDVILCGYVCVCVPSLRSVTSCQLCVPFL